MSIYQEWHFFIINCVDPYWTVVKYFLHFIGTQPMGGQLSSEVLKPRIEQQGPISLLKLLPSNEFGMPLSSLMLYYIYML